VGSLAVAIVGTDRVPDAVADLDRHQVESTGRRIGDRGDTVVSTGAEAMPALDVYANALHVDSAGGEPDELANLVIGMPTRVADPGHQVVGTAELELAESAPGRVADTD
jgi:hypothetical protein